MCWPAKMQPLQWNQKFLTLVSLCAPPDDVSHTKVLLHAALGIYVFVTLCLDLTSSSLFVIQYKKHDMEDILGSVLQTAAVSGVAFVGVSVFMLSKQLYSPCIKRFIMNVLDVTIQFLSNVSNCE